jgi:transcriptional regulator with XRE-family HTH domain
MATDDRQLLVLLGETIREIRLERGMTQQQVADFCRMERTFIIAVEKGRKNASGRTLILIAAALGILPAELFRRFSKSMMKTIRTEQRKD